MSLNHGEEVLLVSDELTTDPTTGPQRIKRFAGPVEKLQEERDARAAGGWRTHLALNEGIAELTLTTADPSGDPEDDDPESDVTYDEWSIQADFSEIDVWSDPKLTRYISENVATGNQFFMAQLLSAFRSTIDDHLARFYDSSHTVVTDRKGPTPLENFQPTSPDGTPYSDPHLSFLQGFYAQLSMGSNKSRITRVKVGRRRTIKYGSPQRYELDSGQLAYLPASFISTFAVPAGLQALLPATPGADETPLGTTWAWALQEQAASNSGAGGRVVERLEWVFGACRNFTFTFL